MLEAFNCHHSYEVSLSKIHDFIDKVKYHKAATWSLKIEWVFQNYSIYSSPSKNTFTIIVAEYGFYPFMINTFNEYYEETIKIKDNNGTV
jgi:hypothetical protein